MPWKNFEPHAKNTQKPVRNISLLFDDADILLEQTLETGIFMVYALKSFGVVLWQLAGVDGRNSDDSDSRNLQWLCFSPRARANVC